MPELQNSAMAMLCGANKAIPKTGKLAFSKVADYVYNTYPEDAVLKHALVGKAFENVE
jgi:hypothetical protein